MEDTCFRPILTSDETFLGYLTGIGYYLGEGESSAVRRTFTLISVDELRMTSAAYFQHHLVDTRHQSPELAALAFRVYRGSSSHRMVDREPTQEESEDLNVFRRGAEYLHAVGEQTMDAFIGIVNSFGIKGPGIPPDPSAWLTAWAGSLRDTDTWDDWRRVVRIVDSALTASMLGPVIRSAPIVERLYDAITPQLRCPPLDLARSAVADSEARFRDAFNVEVGSVRTPTSAAMARAYEEHLSLLANLKVAETYSRAPFGPRIDVGICRKLASNLMSVTRPYCPFSVRMPIPQLAVPDIGQLHLRDGPVPSKFPRLAGFDFAFAPTPHGDDYSLYANFHRWHPILPFMRFGVGALVDSTGFSGPGSIPFLAIFSDVFNHTSSDAPFRLRIGAKVYLSISASIRGRWTAYSVMENDHSFVSPDARQRRAGHVQIATLHDGYYIGIDAAQDVDGNLRRYSYAGPFGPAFLGRATPPGACTPSITPRAEEFVAEVDFGATRHPTAGHGHLAGLFEKVVHYVVNWIMKYFKLIYTSMPSGDGQVLTFRTIVGDLLRQFVPSVTSPISAKSGDVDKGMGTFIRWSCLHALGVFLGLSDVTIKVIDLPLIGPFTFATSTEHFKSFEAWWLSNLGGTPLWRRVVSAVLSGGWIAKPWLCALDLGEHGVVLKEVDDPPMLYPYSGDFGTYKKSCLSTQALYVVSDNIISEAAEIIRVRMLGVGSEQSFSAFKKGKRQQTRGVGLGVGFVYSLHG